MAKHAYCLAMLVGFLMLMVSVAVVNGAGPNRLTDWVPLIASIGGILLGAGLSVLIYERIDRRERLRFTGSLLVAGMLFIALATALPLEYLKIEQWRDVYVGGFGAIAGATLSLTLSHLRGGSMGG